MKSISDVIHNSNTVNSIKKDLPTVNCLTTKGKIDAILESDGIQPEGTAKMLAEMLDDLKSTRYYLLLVREHGFGKLIEIAHDVEDRERNGEIRINKAVYFQGILRRLKMKTKFR